MLGARTMDSKECQAMCCAAVLLPCATLQARRIGIHSDVTQGAGVRVRACGCECCGFVLPCRPAASGCAIIALRRLRPYAYTQMLLVRCRERACL
jgi:hypothetical protein